MLTASLASDCEKSKGPTLTTSGANVKGSKLSLLEEVAAEPSLPKLCKDGELPGCKKSDTKGGSPKRHGPEINNRNSGCPPACSNNRTPNWLESGAKVDASDQAKPHVTRGTSDLDKLFEGRRNPESAKSSAANRKPGLHNPTASNRTAI